MSGLYSALFSMAFTSVAWFAKCGAVGGALAGGVLGYLLIARVLRAQGAVPQRIAVRRTAGVCCLIWGLVLPPVFAGAGFLWGLSHGLGNVVAGPLSTAVRATVDTWMSRANGLRTSVLGRYPLAKRLSEGELATVVRATPEWISEVLGRTEVAALQQKAEDALVPAPVVAFMRGEFETLGAGRRHRAWLAPAIEGLRARARGAASDWPTMQETIESMVAPSVFEGAASSICTRAWRYIWKMVLGALLVSAALAGALRLLWRLPVPAPAPAPVDRIDG
ncbi:MAG TPA: hypothetical protein VH853_11485 [Polyangia bacterium]|jgi:hypothetical protein|nr:hypothetical protein [Polyangia bacterium]